MRDQEIRFGSSEFGSQRPLASLIIFLPFLFSSHFSFAQDTTFRYYPQFTRFTHLNNADTLFSIDTSLNLFYRFNPAEKPFGFTNLGYSGAPAQPMYFLAPTSADIDIGFHEFDVYMQTADAVKFYDTREPFTSVYYQQGSRNEILVSATHAQNITPQLSFGADYNRIRTDGWYQRQTAKISNFNSYVQYHSPSNFYSVKAAFIINDVKVQLNGGITNEAIFSDSTLFDKSLATVYLDSATSIISGNQFLLKNSISLGKRITEIKDSVTHKKILPEFRIAHLFEWERQNFLYGDSKADATFYTGDTLSLFTTKDSLISRRITNELRLTKLEHDSSSRIFKFSADAFLRHSLYKIDNKGVEQQLQSGILGADFSTLFFSKLRLNAFGELNLIDRNSGDFLLNASLSYFLSRYRMLGTEAMISRNHPTIIEDEYHSAFFNWNNAFASMTTTTGNVYYRDQKWKVTLKAGWFNQSNYIYWVQNGIPVQSTTGLSGLQFSAAKDFHLAHFHFDNEVMYQTFGNDYFVSFPPLILRSSLYYQDDEYSHALQSKFGLDVRYNYNYMAPAYQPAVGQFLVQRSEVFHYDPVVDLFLVVKIKAVRAFVLVQNVAQGFLGSGNFAALHYPLADRSLKFGLQWMFWN